MTLTERLYAVAYDSAARLRHTAQIIRAQSRLNIIQGLRRFYGLMLLNWAWLLLQSTSSDKTIEMWVQLSRQIEDDELSGFDFLDHVPHWHSEPDPYAEHPEHPGNE
jgi:hypothetical protein